jgi:hypothetical protein
MKKKIKLLKTTFAEKRSGNLEKENIPALPERKCNEYSALPRTAGFKRSHGGKIQKIIVGSSSLM